MSNTWKIILQTLVALALFALIAVIIKVVVLPQLPSQWQNSLYAYGAAFVLTSGILAAIAQITGLSLKDVWNRPGSTQTKPEHQFASRLKREINFENLRLAGSYTLVYPNSPNRDTEEMSLTLINETGQDIKACQVLLDELAKRDEAGNWQIIATDSFHEPFRWNGGAIYFDGKKDIDNYDRAAFSVVASTVTYPKRVAGRFYMTVKVGFTFYQAEDEHLEFGRDYRLVLGIRGKQQNDEYFDTIRYTVYCRFGDGLPHVEAFKMERRP